MAHADTPATSTPQPARKPRGGARQGSGSKAADGAAVTRVQLSLDADTVAIFKFLGGGNVSLGAREAARLAAKHAGGLASTDTTGTPTAAV